MDTDGKANAYILGVSFLLGAVALGLLLGSAARTFKEYERTVTVKGLAEREYPADVVIWPIQFSVAGNDLEKLYGSIEENTSKIEEFLNSSSIGTEEISTLPPAITDRSAERYGNAAKPEYRYTALQTLTVYSQSIEAVQAVMGRLSELGRQGIVFTGGNYQARTQYLFTKLNEVKPEMVEEATKKAREVAEKFAADSESTLGKIKRASQGQFSISPRDQFNPHIKKVRVVSTIEYYLSD